MHRTTGLWNWAEYSTFSISDEVGKYRLTVAGYSGDAGNAMRVVVGVPQYVSNGRKFTTQDSDNDISDGSGGLYHPNCAVKHSGGWWYGSCSRSRLNKQTHTYWTTDGTLPLPEDVQASHMLVKIK